ncbi:putative transcriptional regulatory protein [Colletotrichum trifolii]|uniref:Putative transcriptional regulatory protein n=1 Tax=Colletotrichum trifolii TaxID=5466 RepID=A0A4R8RA92_COLTR|nr:putative transcriptional regulatory protein [Colletotrichum trifolii]
MAMATSTASSDRLGLNDRQSVSEVYYRRAKALSMGQMMTVANLEVVQVMLLMSQYLQGSQRSIQTWAIHGVAVKAALELGLHSELALQRNGPLEREVRTRTWYGCVMLDRTLSMTFGRPPIIPQTYIRTSLPRHLIQEPGGPEASRWSKVEGSTLFWNLSITLYSVMTAVIDELYETNIASSVTAPLSNTVATVIHVNQKLARWQAALPPSMALVDAAEVYQPTGSAMALKFRVILTLRYHNIHILSHRPILDRCLQALDGSVDVTQESTTLQQGWYLSKEACLQSAESIVRLIAACKSFSEKRPTISFLGAWWFSLYFTFNAALTMVAIKIIEQSYSPPTFDPGYTTSSGQIDEILRNAVNCIAGLDRQNQMVDKCAKFTATLIMMVQSLQASRDAASGNITCAPIVNIAPPNGDVSQNGSMMHNGGMDEAFTDLMSFLPSNLNEFQSTGAPYAMSELMGDLATGDLFW